MESIEKEFIDFYIKVGKTWGMDILSSKLLGILYLDPKEISIEELAKKTGYSLASISNKMRFLENFGMITRIKKPGSRKVYYYMEKDAIKLAKMHFEKIYEAEIKPAKKVIPELLDKFKNIDLNKDERKKYEIIKNYNSQLKDIDNIYDKLRQEFKKTNGKSNN